MKRNAYTAIFVFILFNFFISISSSSYSASNNGKTSLKNRDLPVVTIELHWDPEKRSASEALQKTGSFLLKRSGGDLSSPLNVFLNHTGTAIHKVDYQDIGEVFTIPKEAEEKEIVITPIQDDLCEGVEIVKLTIQSGSYYTVGDPYYAVMYLGDDDCGTEIIMTVTDPDLHENGDVGVINLKRNRLNINSSMGLCVEFKGEAVNGKDYKELESPFVIPAGSLETDILIEPIQDEECEGDETIIIKKCYIDESVTLTIHEEIDDCPSLISIKATEPVAHEGGINGYFTLTRTGGDVYGSALDVNFEISGTATNGVDYQRLKSSITFLAGSPENKIKIAPIQDLKCEGDETIEITILPDPDYAVDEDNDSAEVVLKEESDDCRSWLTIKAFDPVGDEGGDPAIFHVMRTGNETVSPPLDVYLDISGDAENGVDYETIPEMINFSTGILLKEVVIKPVQDSLLETDESVIITILPDDSYEVGDPDSASVIIEDDDVVSYTGLCLLTRFGDAWSAECKGVAPFDPPVRWGWLGYRYNPRGSYPGFPGTFYVICGDVNGDGLQDMIQFTPYTDVWVTLNTAGSFQPPSRWGWPGFYYRETYHNCFFTDAGDFDGDGLDDILQITGFGEAWVARSSGSEFQAPLKWGAPGFYYNRSEGRMPLVGDFNGDTRDDVAQITEYGEVWVALSTGVSFQAPHKWGAPGFHYDPEEGFVPLAGDFNGDGKTDILQLSAYPDVWVALSEGDYFFPPAGWGYIGFNYNEDDGWLPIPGDVNADEKTDLIQITPTGDPWVAISSGSKFEPPKRWGWLGYIWSRQSGYLPLFLGY